MNVARPQLSRGLLWTMSVAAAVAVANIYYNQPMLADMQRTYETTPKHIGLVATFTQIGYAVGMPAFIPLGDFVERRALVIWLFIAQTCVLAGAALSPNLTTLVAASFLIGLTSVVPQIMIPLAAELAAPEQQGKTIGTVLSGVLLGILLARTLSGFVAQQFGWRTMFWVAAGLALVFAILLRWKLPPVHAHSHITYPELMHSIWRLVVEIPKLRQVSIVAAMFFAAFSAFWTTLIFLLETPPYHYGARAAGLFGLIGTAGVLAAPIAGRLADTRGARYVVGYSIIGVLIAYGVFWGLGYHLWALIIGVIVLDASVQAAQVANQSRVLGLKPEARNRVNTVYMICYFGGGSIGSLLGSYSWSRWQWHGVCGTAVGLMLVAAFVFELARRYDIRVAGGEQVA